MWPATYVRNETVEKRNVLDGKVKRRLSATQKFTGNGETQGNLDPTHSCEILMPKFRLPPAPVSGSVYSRI